MRPDEAFEHLKRNIKVTRQRVTIAKAFILKNFEQNTSYLIDYFLQEMEARMPNQVVIHPTVDTDATLSQAAEAISWKLAACEAIWGLIATGLVIPGDSDLTEQLQTLGWTTVVPGSGGQSSGWHLEQLSLPVPRRILLPRSAQSQVDQPLSDPDLFLHSVDISNLSEEVDEALREAVRCFRHDLYLASLAMLGKASEGAWIELGLSLVKAITPDGPVNIEKVKSKIEDPFIGIGKKIIEIVKLYERKDLLESIQKTSGVTLQDLRNAVIWSDAVRESRNSVHYGVKPSMPNNYEKVAALLIGAVPHFRLLYKIMSAVDSFVSTGTSPPH
jgi:hypothetical protein